MQRSNSRRNHHWAYTLAVATSCLWAGQAEARPNKRGFQLEGMIGGAACMPGRAPCRQNETLFNGYTRPSFGTGGALGFRPVKWFMVGGIYRFGLFHPVYKTDDDSNYKWAGQHTVGLLFRPILPLGRLDLGLNLAPAYSRQIFRLNQGSDRDLSQGFAFLVGPTLDVFITDNFFLGAGVDFVFNSQKKVCQSREGVTTCTTKPVRMVAPTHQVLFGLRVGGTFG